MQIRPIQANKPFYSGAEGKIVSALPQSISEDRRVSITEREVEPDGGVIFNMWVIAPGDPAGRYVIRVIIDGAVERVFEFDVE